MKKALFSLISAALLAGCATIRSSDAGGRQMVDIENTCWMLLYCIPLASGEPNEPNEVLCRAFQNSATLENNMRMLDRARKESGATRVENLASRFSDTTYLFLLNRYSCQTSAELVNDEQPPKTSHENNTTRSQIKGVHAR